LIPKEDIAKNNCIIFASYNNRNEDENAGLSWEGKISALKSSFTSQI